MRTEKNRKPGTRSIPDESVLRSRITERQDINNSANKKAPSQSVILVVRGIVERVDFRETNPVTLGRFSPDKIDVDLDLTPYGGGLYGVSRKHAKLEYSDNSYIFITDLDSTNGTTVCGVRLTPYQSCLLRDDDLIALGNLTLSIRFV